MKDLPDTGMPCDPNPVVSIQVQTTRLTGGGVEVVSYTTSYATHWSLYLRRKDGLCEWVKDLEIKDAPSSNTRYGDAMIAAAKLSMQYSAFIEQVK